MTTQATTQLPVPPGERDFEVYRLVTIEQKSTRTAAKIVGISQTRVCQIVQRVADFLIATAPDSEEHPRKQQQLNVARQVAAERISYLGQQAMRCFRKSKGPKKTVRQVSTASQEPVTITTVRESEGDCRYLFAIAKLAVIGSKLPAAGMLGAAVPEEAAETQDAPSEGGCSVELSEQEVTSNAPSPKSNATVSKISTSRISTEQIPERNVEQRQIVHPAPAKPSLSPRKQFAREFFLEQLPPELSPRAQAALNLE